MLSADELFHFDLKGFLVIPGVLEKELVDHCRASLLEAAGASKGIPAYAHAHTPEGPFAELIDHPEVMRVLEHIIDPNPQKIRLEDATHVVKGYGECGVGPHAGGVTTNPNYGYRHHNGTIYAGMTRVVFEMNEVLAEGGGTVFIPGTHKANFPVPETWRGEHYEKYFTGYSCPAGSLVVFSEATCHAASTWKNRVAPRAAVLHAYNHVCVRHHRSRFDPGVIETLTAERQRFFADVHHPQFLRPEWQMGLARPISAP